MAIAKITVITETIIIRPTTIIEGVVIIEKTTVVGTPITTAIITKIQIRIPTDRTIIIRTNKDP